MRGNRDYPAVAAWLGAMSDRSAVQTVRSDDGTLVRLFSRVFGMSGGSAPTDESDAAFGGAAALEAGGKLIANREAVLGDILLHAGLGDQLTNTTARAVVDDALALVAHRLTTGGALDASSVTSHDESDASAAAATASAALSFLRARVSAPRDMSAAAAVQLRAACAAEAVTAYDRFGYS
uniref:Uncharacterized protein n=1 Tax=Haptolina ericina TaxID=156174 RepID=A0A7S3B8G9_9EUKA